MWLIGLVSLVSCSHDDYDGPLTEEALSIELSASALSYEEQTVMPGATRTWTPPASFYTYDALYDGAIHYESLTNKSIDVFLCPAAGSDSLHGRLRYSPSTETSALWKLSIKDVKPEDIPKGNYYAYGFIPRDAADSALIAKLPESSSYADGAVLTIKGMQSVTADASVIIGAKDGFRVTSGEDVTDYDGSYTDDNSNGAYDNGSDTRTNRVRPGDFGFELKNSNNYLFLLFDHLCSAMCINMRVDGDYNSLRTIKLKELYLQTATDDGPTTKKTDITVTLQANDDGSNPIQSIVFTPVPGEASGGTMYSSSEGLKLTTDYSMFLSHFIPHGVTKLILTSTYDVYDKNVTEKHPNGNLIRKNCQATNTLDLKKLVTRFEEVRREYRYNIYLTVMPTYLYTLSEPDLELVLDIE